MILCNLAFYKVKIWKNNDNAIFFLYQAIVFHCYIYSSQKFGLFDDFFKTETQIFGMTSCNEPFGVVLLNVKFHIACCFNSFCVFIPNWYRIICFASGKSHHDASMCFIMRSTRNTLIDLFSLFRLNAEKRSTFIILLTYNLSEFVIKIWVECQIQHFVPHYYFIKWKLNKSNAHEQKLNWSNHWWILRKDNFTKIIAF